MKIASIIGLSSALCLSAIPLAAQETNETEALKKQLQQATQAFERALQENRKIMESLSNRLEVLEHQKAAATNQPVAPATVAPLTPPVASTISSNAIPDMSKRWSPTDPIRVAGAGQNYINLSFDGLISLGTSTFDDIPELEPGGHDPKERGFTIQNLETVLEGRVDPYFRAQASIVLQIDTIGESTIEAEEAYFETLSLPWNLQVKAGEFFTQFGRLNPTHPHTWDFVDVPLVNARILGPDGLRNPGAQVSWLAPTPFYSEFFLGFQNSQGDTAFSFRNAHDDQPYVDRLNTQGSVHNVSDMMFAPRYVTSFNLSDAQTIVVGGSAAFAPNGSGTSADTQIYGVDLFYKWKSPNQHAGFPFVTWQTEGMVRRFGAQQSTTVDLTGDGTLDTVPGETLYDWGFYSQVAYGFRKGWVVALRGDYVTSVEAQYEKIYGPDPERGTRWRISPNITYFPSEFSKIRLQYNYDHQVDFGNANSVWLQFEFLLGSHSAHKF